MQLNKQYCISFPLIFLFRLTRKIISCLTYYMLGGYYSNTYLRTENTRLHYYGITFGVGILIRNTKTSFTYGERGTLDNNLIKERYGIIYESLEFYDSSFFKTKFD